MTSFLQTSVDAFHLKIGVLCITLTILKYKEIHEAKLIKYRMFEMLDCSRISNDFIPHAQLVLLLMKLHYDLKGDGFFCYIFAKI